MQRRAFFCFSFVLLAFTAGCRRIEYEKAEVRWGDGATEADARMVGDYLKREGFFVPGSRATVKVDRKKEMLKSPPTYRVTFVLQDGAWDRPDIVDAFQTMADDMKAKLFGGQQTIVLLVNDQMMQQKKLYGRTPR